ncbi:transcriptional regulator [Streptomyces sp. NPDC057638]|uniref:transcriptional regulator n=1 Tax=Streptomyces sp. NPDC057638 TaxID=3346190 RepID=UPI0036AC3283
MERRHFIESAALSVAPVFPDWQSTMGRMDAANSGEARRLGMPDVDLVVRMSDRLSATYDDLGGRHTRPLAATFLVNVVAPYLRMDGPPQVRKAMLSAAAFLCYLTGWMAVDETQHGLAQKWYLKALQLSGAGGDHLTYCRVLRGMSVQAADLGHGPDAMRFAETAASAAPDGEPDNRAFFAAQRGYASAVGGERRAALARVRDTEKFLDIADSRTGTLGGFNASTLAYMTSNVRYHSGDIKGSVHSLQQHFHLRDETDSRQSGVRFSSLLAERQLEIGHLEEACTTWIKVLEEYPATHSGRIDQHVANIGPLLRPYLANSTARDTFDRARLAARAK